MELPIFTTSLLYRDHSLLKYKHIGRHHQERTLFEKGRFGEWEEIHLLFLKLGAKHHFDLLLEDIIRRMFTSFGSKYFPYRYLKKQLLEPSCKLSSTGNWNCQSDICNLIGSCSKESTTTYIEDKKKLDQFSLNCPLGQFGCNVSLHVCLFVFLSPPLPATTSPPSDSPGPGRHLNLVKFVLHTCYFFLLKIFMQIIMLYRVSRRIETVGELGPLIQRIGTTLF